MLFRNIMLYQLAEPFTLSPEIFDEKLKQNAFLPCPRSANASYGWLSPFGEEHPSYVLVQQGRFLFSFCREQKILPGSVINEALTKKIALLEGEGDRVIYRKEKMALREQIITDLRLQAFTRKKITHVYLDTRENWLIIDTSSRPLAEEICSYLRQTLQSLKLSLPSTKARPEIKMTEWLLQGESLKDFSIANHCDLFDPKQKTATITCKEHDLTAHEIVNHLHSGKQVLKLAMTWQDKIAFEFNGDMRIKKIKFLDLKPDVQESKLQQLDHDFALMSGEFTLFLNDIWDIFDGLLPAGELAS